MIPMFRTRLVGFVVLVLSAGVALVLTPASGSGEGTERNPLDVASAWQTDPIWYDGLAEYAEYRSVRPIYGIDRNYDTVMITNTQHMDASTTTKVGGGDTRRAIPVFKHNVRETVPTENYDYRFLTTAFVRTDTLAPYKVVMSSQEDCGTTYKQFVNRNGRVEVDQFVYFPGAGHEKTSFAAVPRERLHFVDTLSLSLRSFPFDRAEAGELTTIELQVVPEQTSTRQTAVSPRAMTVTYVGRETVSVPAGTIDAYHLRAAFDDGSADHDFWFAADAGSDWLNIMVKYEDSSGLAHALTNHRRWAYWER